MAVVKLVAELVKCGTHTTGSENYDQGPDEWVNPAQALTLSPDSDNEKIYHIVTPAGTTHSVVDKYGKLKKYLERK